MTLIGDGERCGEALTTPGGGAGNGCLNDDGGAGRAGEAVELMGVSGSLMLMLMFAGGGFVGVVLPLRKRVLKMAMSVAAGQSMLYRGWDAMVGGSVAVCR